MLETGPHVRSFRVASRAKSLGDLFRQRCSSTPGGAAIFDKHQGHWRKTTWGGFYDRARQAARGLEKLGVGRGDRVAILGPTRAPWAIYDMGCQLLGAVSFGIYPKQTVEQVRYLLDHSEARVVLVDGADELATVREAARDLPALRIIPWDRALYRALADQDPRLVDPATLEQEPLSHDAIDGYLGAIRPEDMAILIYTSGTTGPPKGAMISHANLLALLRAQEGQFDLFESDLGLSFLPMAHAAERVMSFFTRIDAGTATAYAQGMGSVLDDLKDVRPTIFGAVPRLFEKAYARVQSELEKRPPAARRVFGWAVDVGKRASALERQKQPVPAPLALQRKVADALVYRKLRQAFGGRVRFFATGAAPIALDILEFFWAIGLPIYELYGMTEATVATHSNRPTAVRLGTVGQAISPLETRIADDGEILLRAPWVFTGYFKNPDATAEVLVDGWLHTGDVGKLDEHGFLRITDRKKHLIITAGGKNLAPANIENAIKNQDPLISQVYAHGDRRPYVVALIAPSPLETLAFGHERGLVSSAEVDRFTRELLDSPSSRSQALDAAMARVVVHADFRDRIREAIRRGNKHLAQVEQVRRFALLDRDLSQEHGELTPTLKVKRKEVGRLHHDTIEHLYDDPSADVGGHPGPAPA